MILNQYLIKYIRKYLISHSLTLSPSNIYISNYNMYMYRYIAQGSIMPVRQVLKYSIDYLNRSICKNHANYSSTVSVYYVLGNVCHAISMPVQYH